MQQKHYELKTKEEYRKLFSDINEPLLDYISPGCAGIRYGKTGVGYGKRIAECEGFARFLWGAGPAIHSLELENITHIITKGIKNGTNPKHEEYWGEIHDRDQRMVEMPAIALTLLYKQQVIWKMFSKQEKNNVYTWLNQLNAYECADGNWQFFRVIVNLSLKKLGYTVNEVKQKEALDRIEACYLGDGWYRDSSRGRQDYYTAFSFHYYGLLYSVLEPDAKESQVFRERASEFATQYIHFFSEDGSNVPFGRSMTYRYAVVSFWTALVYANVLPFSLGTIKGIINRNIRWWMNKDIFTEKEILTLGYTYPQLMLTEPYNAPLSPYWSNKIFILLALEESHDYWKASEEPMPRHQSVQLLDKANMLAFHDNGHTQLLNAGQPGPNYHTLTNEKYLKFSYSSVFGFSIPRSHSLKSETAMDSMIGIQPTKSNALDCAGYIAEEYHVRNHIQKVIKMDQYVVSEWGLLNGTIIRTWLVAQGSWQIRIHKLCLTEESRIYETGFALEGDCEDPIYEHKEITYGCYAKSLKGFSGIMDLSNDLQKREKSIVSCLPNTNLMTSQTTALPSLETHLSKGDYWLATGIMAHSDRNYAKNKWEVVPKIYIEGANLVIELEGQENIMIDINEGEKT